ncbi:MAG: DUF1846 domain-containing protein [Defluviitaleaceae bacterium]|nr:DUF1846 domain-containing protein [Defluviitaleaceae bacterium]
MQKIGFDKDKYLKIQSEKILERVGSFDKLYLELGGKIFEDMHGARVLPGFEPDMKIKLLQELRKKIEIVFAINAADIQQNRIQSDRGTNYAEHLIHLIKTLKQKDLYVSSVVITHYSEQKPVLQLKRQLSKLGLNVYNHYVIPEYPTNIELIMSDSGFGKNDYIETIKPIVIVAGPGSGSGKMATCMSQLYHEFKRGVKAGYSKFEKFPVWNLPLNHPVNLAYEAATTNIMDKNMIDPFHLEAYGVSAVNYNRDIEAFPVLNDMFKQIWGESPYKSPTDMGVNMIKECIINENVCIEASKQEIVRRYYKLLCNEYIYGGFKKEIQKLEFLMNIAGVTKEYRAVVPIAKQKAKDTKTAAVAIEIAEGKFVTGKATELLSAPASALLNALKELAQINDSIDLISPNLIVPIMELQSKYLKNKNYLLQVYDVLLALSISTATNEMATLALEQLPKLNFAQAHSTTIISQKVVSIFQNLGIAITCEPSNK